MSEPLDVPLAPGPPTGPPAPPPPVAERPGNPWERREELGFGPALLGAIRVFLLSPTEAYAQTRKSGDFLGPLFFAMLLAAFGLLVNEFWNLLFGDWFMQFLPEEFRNQSSFGFGTSPIFRLGTYIFSLAISFVAVFVISGIHHVSLMLVGALNTSDAGYEGTFRINAFTSAVNVFTVVPILGGLVSIVMYLILATVGAVQIHGTTTGRALTAVLLPFGLCCLCFGLLFGSIIAAGFGMLGTG